MIYIALYIFAMALAAILIHQLGFHIPIWLMLSLATTYAVIFFNFMNIHKLKTIYSKLWSEKKTVMIAMVSAALMVIFSFNVAIKYGATVHMFTYMCATSAYGMLTAYFKNRQWTDLVKSLVVFAILIVFYVVFAGGYKPMALLTLLSMSLMTGFTGYMYMVYSNRLSHLKCSAAELLVTRYWVLFLAALFMMLYQHEYTALSLNVMLQTFIVSALMLILPIFFLQKSIQKIGAYVSATLMGLVPFVTFVSEKILTGDGEQVTCYFSVLLAMVIMLPYGFSHWFKLRRRRLSKA